MGLVKFGAQSFNIEQIPDGHIVISEQELSTLKGVQNSYLALKARIPVGINDAEISALIEKGQRFDPLNQELVGARTQLTERDGKLSQFSNIPKDYSVDEWNRLRKKEAAEIRATKLADLTKKAIEKAETVTGVKGLKVDPRFYDSAKVDKLDVERADAVEQMYAILDEAHTAQMNFMKEMSDSARPGTPSVGVPGVPGVSGQPGIRDTVPDTGPVHVGRI